MHFDSVVLDGKGCCESWVICAPMNLKSGSQVHVKKNGVQVGKPAGGG